MKKQVYPEITQAVSFKKLSVTSPAFSESEMLPVRFTCDGENINPPLEIKYIPDNTKSLAVIMTGTYDGKEEWAHWLAWNITPASHIAEHRKMEMEGLNYFSGRRYEGPCPSGGLHSYSFKVYALDSYLQLPSATTKAELERTISEHILAFGILNCFYRRDVNSKR